MNFTEHPRSLARLAGAFYLMIIAFALFGYLYVRGQLIIPGDMAQTATNIAAREQLYRAGFTAAVVVVTCNLPLGLILFELQSRKRASRLACAAVHRRCSNYRGRQRVQLHDAAVQLCSSVSAADQPDLRHGTSIATRSL